MNTECVETFLQTNKVDSKGRLIGFIVGLNTVDGRFYAWVQNARYTRNGVFEDFGVRQRSKEFKTFEESKTWAYSTAKQRILKVNKK